MPELRDLITGSTPEEVDASIEAMKSRTEQIIADLRKQQQPTAEGGFNIGPHRWANGATAAVRDVDTG